MPEGSKQHSIDQIEKAIVAGLLVWWTTFWYDRAIIQSWYKT